MTVKVGLVMGEEKLKRTIGRNLKVAIKSKGWTQRKASQMSGVDESSLSKYINAKRLPFVDELEKLVEVLGVKMSDIDPSFKGKEQREFNYVEYTLGSSVNEKDDKVKLPVGVVNKLGLVKGDKVEFLVSDDDEIIIRRL